MNPFGNGCPNYAPEKTARRIIPRRGLPRVEWAQGNPWPGGRGNTWAPTAIVAGGGRGRGKRKCIRPKHLLMGTAGGCGLWLGM